MPTPPAWRLSVVTEGAAELKFILPCDDGSMTVLELTRRLVERCQSLTPSVPLVADRLVDARDGSTLFPEDSAREVLDDGDTVKVFLRRTNTDNGSGAMQRPLVLAREMGGGATRGRGGGATRGRGGGATRGRGGGAGSSASYS